MKIIKKDGDLISQFDNINENDIPCVERLLNLPTQLRDTPHQKMLTDNHTDANKCKIIGDLLLEVIFGFCKTFEKVTQNLCFHLKLKTNESQDIIYTSMDGDKNSTIKNLYLFVPNLIPSVETQLMFNGATQNIYKISFDEWYTERRVISDMIVQHDIGLAQLVNSPKYLIYAHQIKNRTNAPNKKFNIAIFDNLHLQKYHVEKDSFRYPRDSLLIIYERNDYIEKYKDIKKFLNYI